MRMSQVRCLSSAPVIVKRTWSGHVEEWPFNLWEVRVTDWMIGKVILLRKVFYRVCHGMDRNVVGPHVKWRLTSGDVQEDTSCPRGCLFVSGRDEKRVYHNG